VSRNVYRVNIDAVISALLLKILSGARDKTGFNSAGLKLLVGVNSGLLGIKFSEVP
jgi:hypothetical protein